MDIKPRHYIVVKRAGNRYWVLANEIERSFGIPKGQMFGILKRKGLNEVDEIYRQVMKEDCDSKVKLFLWKVAQLKSKPRIKKPKQLVLCPTVKATSKTSSK